MKAAEKDELHWAILGTGNIAHEMAQAFNNLGKPVYAVGGRTYQKAVEFREQYHIQKVYKDFHEMFQDKSVDIIYIATPHNTHIEFLLPALEGGKHVLCEKSITLNSSELALASEIAGKKGLILAEAMTIYHMPVYKKLHSLVSSGALGKVNMIQACFGSYKDYDMSNRFFNKSLAGGALLDIGVYALSLARYFMSSKPKQVVSQVKFAPSGVDLQSGILMTNREGEMSVISLTLRSKQPKRCVISCERGYIEIMEYPRADKAVIFHTLSGETECLSFGEHARALEYEIEDMEENVQNGTDGMLLQNTKDVMDIMTALRKEWGMFYPSDSLPL